MSDKATQTATQFQPAQLEARAEDALAAIEGAGASAADLVDAWVKAGNAEAVAVVAERGSGAARKAARRGINVLRSRGIKVEPPPRVVSLGADTKPAELITEAWMVPPDAMGMLLIVIASRSVTSRARSAFFYVHDALGLQDVSTGELSGSRLKDALKRAARTGVEPVRIPVAYARFRVAQARQQLKENNLPEPLGMANAEPLLEPAPTGPEPHPLDAEGLALADEDVNEYAARSGALHALPEFRTWLPAKSAVEELLVEVGKQLPPGEDKPDTALVQKAIEEAIDAATDRYFVPERRAGLVRLMKDCALSVLATQGELRALEVVATIRRIEAAGLITDPPRDVPFLRMFFEKAIATLVMQTGGQLRIPVAPAGAGASAETA